MRRLKALARAAPARPTTAAQRHARGAAGLVALVCLVIPVEARAAPVASTRVTFATASAIYVDAGTADGLAQGAKLEARHRRRGAASCTVVEIAAHHAVCKADGKRVPGVGDRLRFQRAAADAPAAVKPRPDPPTPDALAPLRKKVEAAPFQKVAFKKARRAARPVWTARGSTTLRQQVWATSGKDNVFARPSLDAGARAGIGIFPGLYAAGALRVQGDVLAPPEQRFRPGELQLYLWNASVGVAEGAVVGAAGRFRPQKAPGLELLDGAQAGFRAFGGALEVGGYAGAIPDLVTLAPSIDRLTGGAYFSLDLAAAKDVLVLPRARVGLVSTPDGKTVRALAEAETQVLIDGVVAAGGSARVGAGGTDDPLPTLDAARADLDVHTGPLHVDAGYRYLAPLAVDFDAASGVPTVGGAHHGDLEARYALSSWLVIGADSGAGYDVATRSARGYAGPMVELPTAFGTLGGLELGYAEEADVAKIRWSGRTAYLAATVSPLDVVRIVTRASYFEDAAINDSLREAALMTLIDAPVLPWLSVRGRAQVQAALAPLDGSTRASPTTLVADLGLSGSL